MASRLRILTASSRVDMARVRVRVRVRVRAGVRVRTIRGIPPENPNSEQPC